MTGNITRPSWWDSNIAREALRQRAVTHTHIHGTTTVRFSLEPLLRRTPEGGLTQSVRIDVDPVPPKPITTALLRLDGGAPVRCEILEGPGGSVRLMAPAVESDTAATVELPELASELALPGPLDLVLRPQRRWTLHLVQHAHLDIGYTDPQGTVLAEARAALDTCLDLIRATDSWPAHARFRWTVEGLSTFQDWAAHRPARSVAEFVSRVHEGRIELTAMPFNLHTETCSVDELHELLRAAAEVRERYGVPIVTAMQTDVPGQVVGLQDALADSGVGYLSVAHNWAGRAVPHLNGGARLPRLFRWRTSDGRSVLVWRTDTAHGLAYMEGSIIGFDESYAAVEDLLPAYLAALANYPHPHEGKGVPGFPILDTEFNRDPYPWDILHLRVLGTFGDNGPPRLTAARTVREWNETWAYPQLRLSRHEDFFADAEQRLDGQLETFEGDWSDWWVDGVGAGAAPLAMNRTAQSVITDAGTVNAMADLLGAQRDPLHVQGTADAYRAVSLFNEHTWGAGDPWTHGCRGHESGEQQWHWKYGQAVTAHDQALTLLETASHRLGSVLPQAPDMAAGFHVVNTQSRIRTDVVRLFLPESVVPLDRSVTVLDGRTGDELPTATEAQTNPKHRAAGRFLHVTVPDVPAVGTVRLDLRAAGRADAAPSQSESTELENAHLAVKVDLRGNRIASIIDKTTGAELVAADSAFGFNSYLYDQYATAGGFNHQSSKTVADDSMHLLAARSTAPPAVLMSRTSTAVAETLVYECVPTGATRLRVTLSLPHGVPRLDITNELTKDSTMVKESAFFAFPFAMTAPTVRMEATAGVVGTDLPVIPGSAKHMRAIRRWATLAENGRRVGWATHDAPLVQHGTIAIPYVPYPSSLPAEEPGTLYSWIHNNIWDTNFPSSQAFQQAFRYSVAVPALTDATVADQGPADAELGMQAAATGHPLHAIRARAEAGRNAADAQLSLMSIDHPQVRLVGLIDGDDGAVLARLQSFADQSVSVRITPGLPSTEAWLCTYLGAARSRVHADDDGTYTIPIPPRGTAAVSFKTP